MEFYKTGTVLESWTTKHGTKIFAGASTETSVDAYKPLA
jgi:hypothetical protein